MKKSLVALAVLGSFAGVASAQSSVTLFGIVDVNARWIKTGDETLKSLGNSGLQSSRLGFRGVEDLGGGLKAGFWLESAINNDNGTSNATRFWHRRSTVSLMGSFGEIRLGRDLVPTFTSYFDFDTFGTNGLGDISLLVNNGLGSGIDTMTRSDNMISYIAPNIGGLVGQISVAAGEGAAGRKYIGGKLGYAAGPFSIVGGYSTTEVFDDDYKRMTLAGSWDFGAFKLNALAVQNKYNGAVAAGGDVDNKQRIYAIGGSVPVGPGLIRAQVAKVTGKGDLDGEDATSFAVGYIHNLSKRTAIYTTVAYIKNDEGAGYILPGSPSTFTPEADLKSRGAEIGIRHSF